MLRRTAATLCFLAVCLPAFAQDGPTVTASVRSRAMFWDWFGADGDNNYAYSETLFRLGISDSHDALSWKIDFAAPLLMHLPSDAIAPASQGQLGFGASYYAANSKSTSASSIFVKQGYVGYQISEGPVKQYLRIGRTEFADGSEVTSPNATVATLITNRISERLIGNFEWSDVGRSFDGLQYSATAGSNNLTLLAVRPTRGCFQVDGWGEVNTNLFYGAVNHQTGDAQNGGELRVFAIGYNDLRGGVLKTDNRPQAVRAADRADIDLATVGVDYVHAARTHLGTFDGLAWGVLQGGSWGTQTQQAFAYAVEGGWQAPTHVLRPWLRAGINYGSGDHNPNDNVHGTFFQILPTSRVYARFPFFNMMNNRDVFGEVVLRPSKKVTIRTDGHALALANRNDLWYVGGGAFQPWTFGYTGRPSGGQDSLGTLFDSSVDYAVDKHFSVSGYVGHVTGKTITQLIYPKNKDAKLGYIELDYRY